MHLFFSVGEPSGDQHAARVIAELRRRDPGIRCSGFGGPEMQQQGFRSLFELTNLAVMGIGGVLPLLSTFRDLYQTARTYLRTERPDAVVLVDYPGFNWWVARAAKESGIPVYYYCPPQMWAWAGWRIHKMKRLVDGVLSVLPFEADWYRARGMDVTYVGHPFFDEVEHTPLCPDAMGEIRSSGDMAVGILPGSRKQEVNRNFPVMLGMIDALSRLHPGVAFPVACYKDWHRARCAKLLDEYPVRLPVKLFTGKTSEVIEAADCCLMVSGSVSLELLARRKPAVVMYRGTWLFKMLVHLLATCDYMTLPNLIARREVMPEFPFVQTEGPHIDRMIGWIDGWLTHPAALEKSRRELAALAESIVQTGGVARCAEELLRRCGGRIGEQSMIRAA